MADDRGFDIYDKYGDKVGELRPREDYSQYLNRSKEPAPPQTYRYTALSAVLGLAMLTVHFYTTYTAVRFGMGMFSRSINYTSTNGLLDTFGWILGPLIIVTAVLIGGGFGLIFLLQLMTAKRDQRSEARGLDDGWGVVKFLVLLEVAKIAWTYYQRR